MSDTAITDEELEEFLGASPPSYHTILQVWREVLKPAATEATKPVTPQWCTRIVTNYPGLSFSDMLTFRDVYFGKILELGEVLLAEIASEPESLNVTSAEEDVELNSVHYLNVLLNWQMTFLEWELRWSPLDPRAAIEIGALAEVHKMFLDPVGLVSLLDHIGFSITDAQRDEMASALQARKDAWASENAVTPEEG